jgi:hypothetical protein
MAPRRANQEAESSTALAILAAIVREQRKLSKEIECALEESLEKNAEIESPPAGEITRMRVEMKPGNDCLSNTEHHSHASDEDAKSHIRDCSGELERLSEAPTT